jgi:O-antigen/teichoic acid export membrane protein
MNKQVELIYSKIPFYPYYFLTILMSIGQSFISIPTILIQIKERAFQFISLNFAFFLIKSCLIFYFIIIKKQGIEGYLNGELYSVLLSVPIYYFFIKNDIKFVFDYSIFKTTLLYSIPLIPNIFSAWILDLSDRIFIERYLGAKEVGIYSLGYQISAIVLMLTSSFKQAYDPYFFKIANSQDEKSAKETLYKTNNVFLICTILASFLIVFYANEGLELFFDKKYHSASNIIPIISLSYVISQSIGLLNVMMYQEKKTNYTMKIMIISALINIILNYLLVPVIGMYGAAWATVGAILINFIMSIKHAKRTFYVPFNWLQLIIVSVVLIILYFLFSVLKFENVFQAIFYKSLTLICIILTIIIYYKKTILSIFRK